MYTCTCGTLVASAIIAIPTDGETKSVKIAKDDTLTNVVIRGTHTDTTIDEATVKGFILGPKHVPRGYGRIYDGISTYNHDVEGDDHFGLAEEVYAVNKLLVEIPAATEGGTPRKTTITVSSIKSMEGGTPVIGNSSDGADDTLGTEEG